MFFRAITAQSLCSNFECACAISKSHERQHPQLSNPANNQKQILRSLLICSVGAYNKPDSRPFDIFQRANINGLGVVPQPVAKVNALDSHGVELLAAERASHEKLEQGILDVTMAPVCPFDLGNGSDIASTKGVSWKGSVEENQEEREEERWQRG